MIIKLFLFLIISKYNLNILPMAKLIDMCALIVLKCYKI